MCQAGVEMFEYRLPQSPVEKKILLTHATGVPVCKPSRLNGHAVDVVSVSPGAEPPDDGHGPPLPSPFRVRPKPNLPPTPPYTKASPLHSRLPAFSNSSRQGMLSKKERKARSEKNGLFTAENRMSFEERVKSKFKIKKTVENLEDPDDPYAFPEPDSTGNSPASSSGNVTTPTGSGTMVVQSSPSPIHVDPGCLSQQHSPLSIHSPGPVVGNQSVLHQPQQCGSSNTSPGVSTATTTVPSTTSANQASSGTSSIAKLYPELAEKLERVKPKLDTKIKGRTQGSSTVNRLQTKIAQNRIKDKLKRTHNQDVTSPQRSPVCTPPQRSPVSHDVSSSVTKDPLSERLRHETKSPNLNLSYDGALLRPAGTDGMAIKSMPPPPPPFMGFQNLEQLPDHVISQVGTSAGPAPEKLDLMPPPPYPGLSVGRHSVPFMVEPPPSHLGSSSLSQPPGHRRTISSHHPFFPSGSIGCAQSARQPSPAFLSTIIPVLRTLPRKPKCVLSEKEARAKLKTDSAVRYHSQYIRHKTLNHHYLPFDVAASDEEEEKSEDEDVLPWQQDWFSASSDEEDDEPDDELALHIRTTKLALMRARLRRQFSQSRKSHRSNLDSHASYNQSVLAMIRASREHPSASVRAVELVHHLKPSRTRAKRKVTRKRPCRHKNDNEVQCPLTALPFANHCQKHIMYNVDQQIFDYCTAKFADNTQCCIPVFDIRHELPLCPEHAAKADNYNKGTELKSRPRKKTRPSALTKPPKKGKKKRNQRRNVRPQKPMADSEASGDTEMIMDVEDIKQEVDVEEADVSNGASSLPPTPPVSPPAGQPAPIAAPNPPSLARHPPRPVPKPFEADLPASVLEFADMPSVSEVMEKSFELEQLPLEQASRLLEEQDLHDVLLPDDAFDIFGGRNGEFEPSTEETEALDRALAEASQDVKETLARLSQSMVSGELGNLLGHSLDPTAISGNLPSSRGQHTTATAPAPHVKPAMDSPALYADQQAVGYSQASPTAAVSPSIYPSKQYAPPSHPTTDGQAYVPYRGAAQVTATGDQIIVPGLAMEPQVADVLPDYQNRTLRQQLSVTVPQPSLTIQRRLQLSASPVTASPGRHGSGVASMVTPVTALSVHSPVQAPMTNAHTGWSSPQINPTTTGTTQAYPTAYHNGFPPVKHTSAYYQLPAGTLKYTLSPQVKVENTHFLATHSIGAPASPGNPPKPGHDSANPKASKIT